MAITDAEIIAAFVKTETKDNSLAMLITPPFYLSDDTVQAIKKRFNYVTFVDIVKQPFTEPRKPTLLHLYMAPLANKSCPQMIQALAKVTIMLSGYGREMIAYEQFLRLFEVLRLMHGTGVGEEEENRRERTGLASETRSEPGAHAGSESRELLRAD